jgi:formylglycine-generating enzyme required for sulfatase activity
VCAGGTTACSGAALACYGSAAPTAEICNGLDDNCDGSIDEGAGASCPVRAHTDVTCASARCSYACAVGYADCNANVADGCEASTDSDASNCGGCGIVCSGVCVAGSCRPPSPSCTVAGDGRSNCGPGGTESCCASPLVPGIASATFSRSYDGAGFSDAQYKAAVSDVRLDKYEITVGRFRKYVDAAVAGWRPSAGSGKHTHLNGGNGLASSAGGYEPGWNVAWNTNANLPATKDMWDFYLQAGSMDATWTPVEGVNEKRPINYASWYQVAAFCIWDGGFLPSEAEWNFAAAGGTEQRVYPWGSTVPGPNSNLAVFGCHYSGTGSCSGGTNIAPVGSIAAGAGKWGQLDLGGNIWEWTLDWYQAPYGETLCVNCSAVVPRTTRVVRGGGYADDAGYLRTSPRLDRSSDYRDANFGARCARTPN